MDHYIAEFYKLADRCTVQDYCVFLEQKTGWDRINPFLAQEQMVVFLTDRGAYCVRVRGMGEFYPPEKPEQLGMRIVGKKLLCENIRKQYVYVRKWKDGSNQSYQFFVRALHDSK